MENLDIIYEKNKKNTNILNEILHHPYVDNLNTNLSDINNYTCINIIPYKLSSYNDNKYIEYYIDTNIHSLTVDENVNVNEYCINMLNNINGRKIIKGYVINNNSLFVIVQIRNNININNNFNKWIVLYDILINNHVYGERISENIIDFFIENNNLDNLFIDNNQLLKPLIFYTIVDDSKINYVNKYNTIQYCQLDENILIHLSEYTNNDNIRCMCFINDNSELKNINQIKNTDYIVERKGDINFWIFKNEKYILFTYKTNS